jgi:hypothetical protein
MSTSNRQPWFADVLRAGLETRVLTEPDVLTHATPAVLIASLPKDVVVRLLDATLATGTMSPEVVIQTATPELLAAHVPGPVIWECLAAAAQRAGFAGDGTPDAAGAREYLRRALAQALTHGITTPKDVVEDVNASVLGHHFPDELKTKLLEASLLAGKMNPELILETLGVEAIAQHAPTHVVWACLARTGAPPRAGAAAAATTAATATTATTATATTATATTATPPPPPLVKPPAKPSLEVLDDVGSVVVELDDASGTMEVSRDKDDPALGAVTGTIDDKKKQGGRPMKRA